MSLSKDLVRIMRSVDNKKTSGYDTEAVVTRIDGDTVWVRIPDGVDETPVKRTIDAKEGDSVQVRVSDGDAFLVGNGTRPPTDDYLANKANNEAIIAGAKADMAVDDAKRAREAADQAVADSLRAREAAESAEESAESASASASSAQASASSAQQSANSAGQNASRAQAAAEAAQQTVLDTITSDTLHYLATSLSSGVTRQTSGWTTTVQTMTSTNKYLWTYHTYTNANGQTTDTNPIITGTFGEKGADGTSVTILGSYNTLADLQREHPTGSRGDAYMVNGDLYVWSGTAWENVGQIQGPQGDDGVSITAVQPQYYLSTSSSSATGGSWGNTISYVLGKYIWTRDQISYSNSTTGYSTAIYNEALTQSCRDAAEAMGLVLEQQEYFWHDSLGAHVLGDASGYRNDITSTGMKIVDATASTEETISEFGETVQIGSDTRNKMIITEENIRAYSQDGVEYFVIDSNGGQAAVYTQVGNMPKNSFSSSVTPSIIMTDHNWSSAWGALASGGLFKIGANITVLNGTATVYRKGVTATFTKGTSKTVTIPGFHSGEIYYNGNKTLKYRNIIYQQGGTTYSSGEVITSFMPQRTVYTPSYRFGEEISDDSGKFGFAIGKGTQSKGDYQLAMGKYNVADTSSNYVLVIGNGTSSTPANILTVDWNGNLQASGRIQDTVKTVTPSITGVTSGATISGITAAVSGNVCTLNFNATKNAAVSAGSNVLTATLNDYKPKVQTLGISYYGSSGLILSITSAGAITIRNIGASLAANSQFGISVTYVLA